MLMCSCSLYWVDVNDPKDKTYSENMLYDKSGSDLGDDQK